MHVVPRPLPLRCPHCLEEHTQRCRLRMHQRSSTFAKGTSVFCWVVATARLGLGCPLIVPPPSVRRLLARPYDARPWRVDSEHRVVINMLGILGGMPCDVSCVPFVLRAVQTVGRLDALDRAPRVLMYTAEPVMPPTECSCARSAAEPPKASPRGKVLEERTCEVKEAQRGANRSRGGKVRREFPSALASVGEAHIKKCLTNNGHLDLLKPF